MQHKNEYDCLDSVIKSARNEKHMTQNQLALELDITTRHLMAIENNNKKPSYDLLFRLIRKLEISADTIFYPNCGNPNSFLEKLRILLNNYEEKEIDAAITALIALIDTERQHSMMTRA